MNPNARYTIVGITISLLVIGLGATILWLSNLSSGKESKLYLSYLQEAVSGLSPHAPVKYNGVDIGFVQEIRISQNKLNQIELLLAIRSNVIIREADRVILAAQGITGLQYIEIESGTENSPILQVTEGNQYPIILSKPSTLQEIRNSLDPVIKNINQTTAKFSQILEQTDVKKIHEIIDHVHQFTSSFVTKSQPILDKANTITNNIEASSVSIKQLTQDAMQTHEEIQKIIQKIDNSVENTFVKVNTTLENVNQTSQEAQILIKKLQDTTDQKVNTTLENVNQTSQEAQILIKKLQDTTDQVEFAKVSQEVHKTLIEIQDLSKTLKTALIEADVSETSASLRQTLKELQKVSQSVKQTTEMLNQNPSSLLFSNPRKEINVLP